MTTPDDKFYRAKIVKRIDYAPDLWMIRIDPGGEFQFAPGRYCNASDWMVRKNAPRGLTPSHLLRMKKKSNSSLNSFHRGN